MQLRTRNSTIDWTERNAPAGTIERLENGLLGFRFDERFDPYISAATLKLIARIRVMRKESKTFKSIAAELGISKTRAFNLNNKWVPEKYGLEEEEDEFDDEDDELDEEAAYREMHIPEPDAGVDIPLGTDTDATPPKTEPAQIAPPAPVHIPRLKHGPRRVSVYDLTRGLDRDGEEIFIESADEDSGRPKIYYQFDRRGNKVKFVHDNLGRTVFNLGPTEYL